MGALGRKRAFLLVPDNTKLAIPSDLLGITFANYDRERFEASEAGAIASIQQACSGLRSSIDREWAAIQSRRESRLHMVRESRKQAALQRLHTVAVEVRDIFVVLPGQVLDAVGDRPRFAAVKKNAAAKVRGLARAFEDDARDAGLSREFDALIEACQDTITAFPHPDEVLPTSDEALGAVAGISSDVLSAVSEGRTPLGASLERAIQKEIEARFDAMGSRYTEWWRTSQPRLQAATTRLQEALSWASIRLTGRVLLESVNATD